MTVTPVLGSALINTVSLQKKSPSGPLLTLSQDNLRRLSWGAIEAAADSNVAVINWLREEPVGLKPLQVAAGFKRHSEHERSTQLSDYIASNAYLKSVWKDNARKYLLANGD